MRNDVFREFRKTVEANLPFGRDTGPKLILRSICYVTGLMADAGLRSLKLNECDYLSFTTAATTFFHVSPSDNAMFSWSHETICQRDRQLQ